MPIHRAYTSYKLGNKIEAEFNIFYNEFKKLFNMNPFDLFKSHKKGYRLLCIGYSL